MWRCQCGLTFIFICAMEHIEIPDWAYEPFEMGFAVGGPEKYAFPESIGEANVFACMVHAGYGKLPKEGAVTFYKSKHSGHARVRVRYEGVNMNAADGGVRNLRIVTAAREGKYINHEYFKRQSQRRTEGGNTAASASSTQIWVRGEINRKFSQLDPPNSVTISDREDDPSKCERQ